MNTFDDFRAEAAAAKPAYDKAFSEHSAAAAHVVTCEQEKAALDQRVEPARDVLAAALAQHQQALAKEAEAITRGDEPRAFTAKVNSTAAALQDKQRAFDTVTAAAASADHNLSSAREDELAKRKKMNQARYILAQWEAFVIADDSRPAVLKAEAGFRQAERELREARAALLQLEPNYIGERRWSDPAMLLREPPPQPPPRPAPSEYVDAVTLVGYRDKEEIIAEAASYPYRLVPMGVRVRVPKSMLTTHTQTFIALDEWERRQAAAQAQPSNPSSAAEWFEQQKAYLRASREAVAEILRRKLQPSTEEA
jgi:hypothetical protein